MTTTAEMPTSDQLIIAHARLSERYAWRWSMRMPEGVDRLRIVEAALETLVKCGREYDPSVCGGRFRAFLVQRLRFAFVDEVRRMLGRKGQKKMERLFSQLVEGPSVIRTSASGSVSYFSGGGTLDSSLLERLMVDHQVRQPHEILEEREMVARAWEIISVQSYRTRQVFELLYVAGLTQAEAADHLLLTEGRISQLHTKCVGRLREQLRS